MSSKKEPKFEIPDSKRSEVEEEILNLKNQPGWQRVVEYYDNKIKYLEQLLAEDNEIKTIEDLKLVRVRRNMSIQFKNLPDILLDFIEKGEGTEVELDPYAKG